MKFAVSDDVFASLENICFGVVVAKGIDSSLSNERIAKMLAESIRLVEEKFTTTKAKEAAEIAPYRAAFTKLGMNPNKFMSSIEAMATRLEKGKGFPSINPVVDLGNAISLKYLLPLGAHDLDAAAGDICVRYSNVGDRFIPFGSNDEEYLDAGELIYSVGDQVKTRRWIWRQSERGKVTLDSKNVFFPIDGFTDTNMDCVLTARDELAHYIQEFFNCSVIKGFISNQQREMEF